MFALYANVNKSIYKLVSHSLYATMLLVPGTTSKTVL